MPPNPYAPPTAAFPPDTSPPLAPGRGPTDWTISELVSAAWTAFKRDWPVIAGTALTTGVVFTGLTWVLHIAVTGNVNILDRQQKLNEELMHAAQAQDWATLGHLYGQQLRIGLITNVGATLLAGFLLVGMTRVLLASVRGEKPRFSLLFSGTRRHFPYVGAWLLFTIVTALGVALLIVPGFVLGVALCPWWFVVADSDAGPMQTLAASWAATKGQRWSIFGFLITDFLLVLAGYVCCCLPVLVSLPVGMLAFAALYVRLTGRDRSTFP